MKRELELLEELLFKTILPVILKEGEVPVQMFQEHQQTMHHSAGRIKEELGTLALSHETDGNNKSIRSHYKHIVWLSNEMLRLAGVSGADDLAKAHPALTQSLLSMQQLLEYMEQMPGNYIDVTEQAAKFGIYRALPALTQRYKYALKKLENDMDRPIHSSMTNYVETFWKAGQITLMDFEYFQKILRGLESIIDEAKPADRIAEIWQLFVYFDFNKHRIQNHARTLIRQISRADNPVEKKLDDLLELYYDIEEFDVNKEWKYAADHDSLKVYILQVINSERNYLREKQTEQEWQQTQKEDRNIQINSNTKMLCLLAEICVRAMFIPVHSVRHIVRVFGLLLGTPLSGTDSLEKTYSKGEFRDESTVNELHDLLTLLSNTLRNTYGNLIRNK